MLKLLAEHGGAADPVPQHVLFQHDREPVIAFTGHVLGGDADLDRLLDVISKVRAAITLPARQLTMASTRSSRR